MRIAIAVGLLLLAGSALAGEPVELQEEKAEITKTIETSIKWCFPDKSRERLYGGLWQDPAYFMFQSDSRATMIGFEAFREFAERVFMVDECRPLGSTIKDLRVNLSQGGDVAWFSCLLDDWGEWAGLPWNWEDCRWTGVLQKMDGRWLIVQQHFSLAEDKVQARVEAELKAAGD